MAWTEEEKKKFADEIRASLDNVPDADQPWIGGETKREVMERSLASDEFYEVAEKVYKEIEEAAARTRARTAPPTAKEKSKITKAFRAAVARRPDADAPLLIDSAGSPTTPRQLIEAKLANKDFHRDIKAGIGLDSLTPPIVDNALSVILDLSPKAPKNKGPK